MMVQSPSPYHWTTALAAAALVLVAATTCSATTPCSARSGLNGMYDGMKLLRELVLNPDPNDEDIWFLPNAEVLGNEKQARELVESLITVLNHMQDLEELEHSDIVDTLRSIFIGIANDSCSYLRDQLNDQELDCYNVTVLQEVQARLIATNAIVELADFMRRQQNNFGINFSTSDCYQYRYWKEHVKDRCICCYVMIEDIESRVFRNRFTERAKSTCCPL